MRSTVELLLGENAQGMIIYLRDGLTMQQMTAGNAPKIATDDLLGGPEGERRALFTLLAYFGRYEVKIKGVSHDQGRRLS
jgi:lipocalin-like protein